MVALSLVVGAAALFAPMAVAPGASRAAVNMQLNKKASRKQLPGAAREQHPPERRPRCGPCAERLQH